METTSTLGLLFEITADPSKAAAVMESYRGQMQSTLAGMMGSSSSAASLWATQITEGNEKVGSSTRESTEAFRGLGEEIGVRLPRFVTSFLSHIGGIAP